MELRHIVLAADMSEASRVAARVALQWAQRAGARLTVLTVARLETRAALAIAEGSPANALTRPDDLGGWIESELARVPGAPMPEFGIVHGLAGIEIPRFAEAVGADLVVLGRKQRSPAVRLLIGDTADAVLRRSRVPCLLAAAGSEVPDPMLVALDGTPRGRKVLDTARGYAAALGVTLRSVTVEPERDDEPEDLARRTPAGRTLQLLRTLDANGTALQVRRGSPVTEILREVDAQRAPLLVVGVHRGGPPGIIEAGSVARRLVHVAPCAVLTVPL